jgi:hypothetical protein
LLDASRTAARYLDVLRGGRWLRVPEADLAHDVDARERWLRTSWRLGCAEAARFEPPPWRAAIALAAVWPDLDALEALRGGTEVPDWVREDAWLGPLAALPASARAPALARTPYAALAGDWPRSLPLSAAWSRHWSAALPPLGRHVRASLATVCAALSRGAGLPSAARRETLEAAARRLLRTDRGSGATALAWLATLALDLERVRGGLAARDVGSVR